MDYLNYLTTGYSVIAGLIWIIAYGYVLKQIYAPPNISRVNAPEPSSFPSLSVLVPACNEADTIRPALQSLLEQDYPNIEVIAINDRSTDHTGEIIDQLSEQYDNLRAVHIENLPDGWLGKTHALKKGYEISEGDWVLATDADVHYKRSALRNIVAVALHHDRDHISCIPNMKNNGFWHEAAFDGFASLLFSQRNLAGVPDPESEDYFGFGAFNMFRRTVFDQTNGFEWLRMEITDDMGIAQMLRDHGAKQGVYYAFDQLELEWYGSMRKMVEGLEKNSIGVIAQYNYLKGFLIPVIWLLFFMGPLFGLFSSFTAVQVLSAGVITASIPFNILAAFRLERPLFPFLFSVLGALLPMFALLRSTFACVQRGGINWRGTFYPVDELREMQRVRF